MNYPHITTWRQYESRTHDLGCRESEKVPGTFVLVRDAAGQQLITVEVQAITSLVA